MNVEIINSRVQAILSDIRTIRLKKGYSQGQCGAMIRVSQNTFSKIESGNLDLTVERLMLIATVLDVDFFDLLTTQIKTQLFAVEGELMRAG